MLLTELTDQELLATWRLARKDGSVVGYGAGVLELLETMELTRPAAWMLARIPGSIFDCAYRLVARHREKLGSLVPDGPGPRSFP